MLKSENSNIRALVKFTNTSERDVEVHWINFKGERVKYKDVEPNGCYLMNTYCTHPWIFTCSVTGERLQVNHEDVFLAEPWFKYVMKAENGLVSVGRQAAAIHLALKPLREICSWRILFLLHSKEEIAQLEVPDTLKAELIWVYKQSSKCSGDEKSDEEEEEILED